MNMYIFYHETFIMFNSKCNRKLIYSAFTIHLPIIYSVVYFELHYYCLLSLHRISDF